MQRKPPCIDIRMRICQKIVDKCDKKKMAHNICFNMKSRHNKHNGPESSRNLIASQITINTIHFKLFDQLRKILISIIHTKALISNPFFNHQFTAQNPLFLKQCRSSQASSEVEKQMCLIHFRQTIGILLMAFSARFLPIIHLPRQLVRRPNSQPQGLIGRRRQKRIFSKQIFPG